MDHLTNTLFYFGLGIISLLLTIGQYYINKSRKSGKSPKYFKSIKRETNPTAIRIRFWATFLLAIFLISLSIINFLRLL